VIVAYAEWYISASIPVYAHTHTHAHRLTFYEEKYLHMTLLAYQILCKESKESTYIGSRETVEMRQYY